jgi:signal transduction histidine kinase
MDMSIALREPNRQAVGTAVLMAAMGALIAVTLWGQRGDQRFFPLDLAAGLASWALLPLLSRKPIVAVVALDVLAVLSPAATPAATVAALEIAKRRGLGTAVRVGLLGIAAHAMRGLVQPVSGLPYVWWLVLVAAVYAALVGWGALSQARTALIDSLCERADRAEAEQGRRVAEARALERARIAREMHDVLAHRLSLVATYAGALEYRPDAPPEQLSRAAGVIRTGVHQALTELRDVLTVLRDHRDGRDDRGDRDGGDSRDEVGAGDGGDGDCVPVPQPVLADLPLLLAEARDCGTPVELTDRTVSSQTLPASLSRTAYRVVQEGLTNARKHAPGRQVRVTLDGAPGGRLTVELRNPVRGAPETTVPGSGTGLIGLTERVRLAGGRIDHQTVREEFLLRASLPFPADLS